MVGSGSGISKQIFLIALYQNRSDPGSGAFLPPGTGIRDGAMVGSGIKHPGSATLVPNKMVFFGSAFALCVHPAPDITMTADSSTDPNPELKL
jgi:hypothetical protein